ncbi:MAG: hypothetical protein M1815_001700 [Lichina confinis]|nr:MAG: hypothetical protein M1815_001700 [Lichina confinis]
MADTSVAMSTTKADFFAALGLYQDNPEDCRLYQRMNEEAEVVWDVLVSNKANRKEHALNKPAPSFADLTDAAIEEAVRGITDNASEQTRDLFRRGPNSKNGPHWPAKWVLYHLFRNRDNRNKTRRGAQASPSAEQSNVPAESGAGVAQGSSGEGQSGQAYDPIRDQ